MQTHGAPFCSAGSGENDMDWTFCGLWLHDLGSPQLDVNISPGCSNVSVSANRTTLSIHGQVTAQCRRFNGIQLDHYGLGHEKASNFCLYWEPALDRLILQVRRPDSEQQCTEEEKGKKKERKAANIETRLRRVPSTGLHTKKIVFHLKKNQYKQQYSAFTTKKESQFLNDFIFTMLFTAVNI